MGAAIRLVPTVAADALARQRERAVDVGIVQAVEVRGERCRAGQPVGRDDLVDRAELFVRDPADRGVERVAHDERTGHDRGAEQRAEHDEHGLARPAYRVAQREPAEHLLAQQHVQERQRENGDEVHGCSVSARGRDGPAETMAPSLRHPWLRCVRTDELVAHDAAVAHADATVRACARHLRRGSRR